MGKANSQLMGLAHSFHQLHQIRWVAFIAYTITSLPIHAKTSAKKLCRRMPTYIPSVVVWQTQNFPPQSVSFLCQKHWCWVDAKKTLCSATSPRVVAEVVLIGLIVINRLSPPGDVFENKCWTIYVAVYSPLSRKLCLATSPRVVAEVVLIGLHDNDRQAESPLAMFLKLNVEQFMLQCIVPWPRLQATLWETVRMVN